MPSLVGSEMCIRDRAYSRFSTAWAIWKNNDCSSKVVRLPSIPSLAKGWSTSSIWCKAKLYISNLFHQTSIETFSLKQVCHCTEPKLGVKNRFKSGCGILRSNVMKKRAMQDSNPRLRLRRPEGYPDYPNRPNLPRWLPFLKEMARRILKHSPAFKQYEQDNDWNDIQCEYNVAKDVSSRSL